MHDCVRAGMCAPVFVYAVVHLWVCAPVYAPVFVSLYVCEFVRLYNCMSVGKLYAYVCLYVFMLFICHAACMM